MDHPKPSDSSVDFIYKNIIKPSLLVPEEETLPLEVSTKTFCLYWLHEERGKGEV